MVSGCLNRLADVCRWGLVAVVLDYRCCKAKERNKWLDRGKGVDARNSLWNQTAKVDTAQLGASQGCTGDIAGGSPHSSL